MNPRFRRNCGEPLTGGFCAQCGQSDTDYDVPIRDFAGTFLSESFDLDSRLRQTLRPLFFRPGGVAAEYVLRTPGPLRAADSPLHLRQRTMASRRKRRWPRIRPRTRCRAFPGSDGERGSLADRLGRGLARVSEDPEDFSDVLLNRVAQSMFVLLPAFALILKMLHRRRLYVPHLVFAIYLHSVTFLLITAAVGMPGGELVGAIFVLGIPAHLVTGMQRFYGQRWLVTVVKAAAVAVVYGMLVGFTMVALMAVSVFLLGGR